MQNSFEHGVTYQLPMVGKELKVTGFSAGGNQIRFEGMSWIPSGDPKLRGAIQVERDKVNKALTTPEETSVGAQESDRAA